MMNFLYSITIYPLELAYRYIYLSCVELIGSYGLSLFVLAIISTLIYTPLKKMAAKAQDKERLIQEIMDPQLKQIKQQSTGAVQHKRIAKLYYRYAYHPIFALRSVIGVALQLPFLCAAYYMLSTLPDIAGHSFGVIADLSKPDALLASINFLPILMTFFNIAATYASPNFSRKEQLQAVIVACLFLALLYNAPSALLLYWTANNALLCFQTLVAARKNKSVQENSTTRLVSQKKTKVVVKEPLYVKVLTLMLTTLIVLFFSIILLLLTHLTDPSYLINPESEKIISSATIFILSIIPVIFVLMVKHTKKFRVIKLCFLNIVWIITFLNLIRSMTALSIPLINITFNQIELFDSNIYFFIAGMLTIACLIPFKKYFYLKHKIRSEKIFFGYDKSIYFSAIATLGLLIIFFSPTALYISSPDFFRQSLSHLLLNLVPYAIGYAVISILIWFISPKLIKKYLVIVVLLVTIISLFNALLFNGDYGALDGLLFHNTAFFGSPLTIFTDITTFISAIAILIIANKYRLNSQLISTLNLASCSLIIFCIFNIYTMPYNDKVTENQVNQQQTNTLPDYNDRLYSFSKTEPNVVVFMLDMFNAGDVPKILKRHPELKQRLSGFTWYDDTVAVGSGTVLSTPSIYAGAGYTPEALNQKDIGKQNSDKKAESLGVLTNQFNRHNFDVSLLEAPLPLADAIIEKHLDKDVLFVGKLSDAYTYRWMGKLGIPKLDTANMSHYMLAVSLFRAAPHQIKRNIYRDWQWFGVGKALFSNQDLYNTLSNTAYFALLPEVANTRSQKGTVKFFYNMLSHYPWHLAEDSLVPVVEPYPKTDGEDRKVDGYYPAHYYTEQHLLLMLADFFDWMKLNGVYDNTLIVLVSDHDQHDSVKLLFKNKPLMDLARPHALLMVKDINQQQPLRISTDLMSTSDVAPIICTVIKGCDGIELLKTDPQRVRKHVVGFDKKNADFFGTFIRYHEYTITGTMFDEDNWQLKPYKE